MKRRIFKDLRSYLQHTGETQDVFAKRVGIKQSHMSLILNGKRSPSGRLALRISRVACIPIESLISADD